MGSCPSSTVRQYCLGGTDSTPCLRVGHPGSCILPVATVMGSGIEGRPNQSEGDSVLRNGFGKRESPSADGC